LKEAKKCVILCMNCHALEHKALNRGETLINDPDAYLRYRNHRRRRSRRVSFRLRLVTQQRYRSTSMDILLWLVITLLGLTVL
jgi:5-methylcytosine-specific restriction endonuclease McrA